MQRLGRWLGAALVLPILAPVAVLLIAALTDRGPDGAVRFSLFPAVLTLYDPLVLDSLTTSLVVAGLVAVVALLVGVPHWDGSWPVGGSGGVSPLAALVCVPVVIPPLFGPLGLRLLMGDENLVPWAATSLSWRDPWNAQIGGVWLVYVWVELASLTPLVVLAVARAIGRIDPAWEEAGRAAGECPKKVCGADLAGAPSRGVAPAGVVFAHAVEPGWRRWPWDCGARCPASFLRPPMEADWAAPWYCRHRSDRGRIALGSPRSAAGLAGPVQGSQPRWPPGPDAVSRPGHRGLVAAGLAARRGARAPDPWNPRPALLAACDGPVRGPGRANASLIGVMLASLAVGGAVTGIDLGWPGS